MRRPRLAIGSLLAVAACQLPPDDVSRRELLDAGLVVDQAGADLGPHGFGTLRILATDRATGLPEPARVLVEGIAPTRTPRLDIDPETNRSTNGERTVRIAPLVAATPDGVILVSGDGAFQLPVGRYRVFVTRGPEWEADEEVVIVEKDTAVSITAALDRSVDTMGWLGADLHVHTERSFDSALPPDDRVMSEVSVGVSLLASTDHDVLTDLGPAVAGLGYGRLVTTVVGVESDFLEGHAGAWPMPYDPTDQLGGGAVAFGLDWTTVHFETGAELFDRLHQFFTEPVVVIHHPRLAPDLGYFLNLREFGPDGWSPPTPLPTASQLDGMELLDGYDEQPDEVATLLRDWFFFLSSGTRMTALGSSDSHHLRDVKGGFPRTWLRLPSDDPTEVGPNDLADAIRGQRAVVSTAPFAHLTVDDYEVGDLDPNTDTTAIIDATVDAPAWIEVDDVKLYINGQVAQDFPVAPGLRPVFHLRWRQSLPGGDAWIALEAHGTTPLATSLIGERGAGKVLPFVITNPVFVDGNADGQWVPRIANPDPGPISATTF